MGLIGLFEDTGVLRIRIEKLMDQYGLFDVQAFNYEEILRGLHIHKLKEMELLVVDMDYMPDKMIGILEQIREKLKMPHLPIIGLSSTINHELIGKIMYLRPIELVAKPFEDITLIEKVMKQKQIPRLTEVIVEGPKEQHQLPKWAQGYAIGVSQVDSEHMDIILKFETLYEYMKEGKGHSYYKELLEFLEDYIEKHFSHEEALHREKQYPLLEEHHAIHEAFKNQIRPFLENRSDVTDLTLIRINRFVRDWLLQHILVEDKKFGEFMIKQL